MGPSVIYVFVSPSGRAYAGWHGIDHATLPRRGTGPLPDKKRYTGSGKLWQNVARKHGPNLRWIILRRFPEGTPRAVTDAAEQRAISLARAMWGVRCANLADGGKGLTSREARDLSLSLWADPGFAAKVSDGLKERWRRPGVRERWLAALQESLARPEVRQKKEAAAAAAMRRPEVRAKNSASNKAQSKTPEGQARLTRSQAAKTPQTFAQQAATLRATLARKRLAALEQAHEGRADPLLGVHEVRPDTLP